MRADTNPNRDRQGVADADATPRAHVRDALRTLHQCAARAEADPNPERERGVRALDIDRGPEAGSARAILARCLEDDLADALRVLPGSAKTAIEALAPGDAVFDGPNYSVRRRMAAGWIDWLEADAAMPDLVRALARIDEVRLNRLIEDAGLVHAAVLVAGLTPERRVRFLSGLGEGYSDRVTGFLRDTPEPHPRRELIKARLHEMLSRAEADGPRAVPRTLGLDALAALLAGLPADQREHVRRAWPAAVYNEVTSRRIEDGPHWRLAEATWRKLVG